jgi:hypothetical protein
MEFSKSQKGNSMVTYLGFEYRKFRENVEGVITWRCRHHQRTNCKALLKTSGGNISGQVPDHSHDSCPQKAKANIMKSKMKDDMVNIGATASNVIGSSLIGVPSEVMTYLPKHSSLTRNLLRHRNGERLPNPTTPSFTIPEKYSHLVLHDTGEDDPDRILAMGDKDMLQELDKDAIYGDGTFDKVPNMFYQLYTWHAKIGNSYPPCVYFLLQKKNLNTYSRMFEILKELLPNLSPRKVLVDFEKACMSAALIAFPQTDVKGCHFHLCQSLIRKINSVGLKAAFESDIEVKLKLKSLAALAFVPVQEVRTVFDEVAATFPDEDSYNEVLTYFFSTYIEGAAGRDPQFPIRIWNQYEAAADQSPKTTNCCEGFHNALNSIFHCSHPSIWFLFDGLQRDIANRRLILTKAQVGQPEVKRKKYDLLHQQVANVVQGYQAEQDKLKYLRRMANLQ